MLKNTKLYSILNNKCPKCCIGDFYKDKNIYKLTALDLRGWLSQRYDRSLTKSSTARALSGVLSFFKYLKKQKVITDHAIFQLFPPNQDDSAR